MFRDVYRKTSLIQRKIDRFFYKMGLGIQLMDSLDIRMMFRDEHMVPLNMVNIQWYLHKDFQIQVRYFDNNPKQQMGNLHHIHLHKMNNKNSCLKLRVWFSLFVQIQYRVYRT